MGKFIDLSGRRFGKLVVLGRIPGYKLPNGKSGVRWECICDCGRKTYSDSWSLTHGEKISCGCTTHELLSSSMKRTHGKYPEIAINFKKMATTHGESKTRLYRIWRGMKSRCNDLGCAGYKNYGARGIKVCPEWESDFLRFKEWALANGYDENAPQGQCTLDRIDVNGDYRPDNCRWISQKEQMQNKRNTHYITHNGETHSIAEWSEILNVPTNTLYSRAGWLGWPENLVLDKNGAEIRKHERASKG